MNSLPEKKSNTKILELFFQSLDDLSEEDFMEYINWFLNRKHDKGLAIKQLHGQMSRFNYLANNFYTFFNNQYYYPSLTHTSNKEEDFYTVEEIAKKFSISVKTISNWEKAGLKILRPSPRVLIISKVDLYTFFDDHSSSNFREVKFPFR